MAPKRPSSDRDGIATDSPVFRLHHTTSQPVQMDQRCVASGPWSADEHQRFLEALEKFGCGQSTSVFAAWLAITAAVATRSVPDVKAHATRYYAQLQTVNTQKRREYLAMQQIDTRWTLHEDAQLEDELATHIPASACYAWKTIARCVPGKTPRETRERYLKLCYDVSRIEAGQHVMMHLGRYPRREQAYRAAGDGDGHGNGHDDGDGTSTIDCVVVLTSQETQNLLFALERVPVPSHASPDVLAAVASAVAALASSKNRQPPKRTVPHFTVADACHSLQGAIEDELCDPIDVLELLVHDLDLTPPPPPPLPHQELHLTNSYPQRQQQPLDHVFRSPHQRARGQTLAPTAIATASFAFGVAPPTPSADAAALFSPFSPLLQSPTAFFERDDTRAGEELLTHLKTSPVHNPRAAEERRARRLQRPGFAQFHDDCNSSGGSATVYPFPLHSTSSFPYSLIPQGGATESERRDHTNRRVPDDDSMRDYL